MAFGCCLRSDVLEMFVGALPCSPLGSKPGAHLAGSLEAGFSSPPTLHLAGSLLVRTHAKVTKCTPVGQWVDKHKKG